MSIKKIQLHHLESNQRPSDLWRSAITTVLLRRSHWNCGTIYWVCGGAQSSPDRYDLIVVVVLSDRSRQQETSFSSVSRSSLDIPQEGTTPAPGGCCKFRDARPRRCPGSRDARERWYPCAGAGRPPQPIHQHPALRGRRRTSQKVTESPSILLLFHERSGPSSAPLGHNHVFTLPDLRTKRSFFYHY